MSWTIKRNRVCYIGCALTPSVGSYLTYISRKQNCFTVLSKLEIAVFSKGMLIKVVTRAAVEGKFSLTFREKTTALSQNCIMIWYQSRRLLL